VGATISVRERAGYKFKIVYDDSWIEIRKTGHYAKGIS